MNTERYKQRSKRIAITGIIWLLICVVVIIGIAVFFNISPYALKNKYRHFSGLNGDHPWATITVNGKDYGFEYSRKYHRLSDIPEEFSEISREDNEIVSEYFAKRDAVFASEDNPEVIFVRSLSFNNPTYSSSGGYYYCLVNSDVRYAHLVYKNHDWCYNYLTCFQGAEDIPDDLKELSSDKFTVDDDFLRECPSFTSRKTGMVYFEVMEDMLYIPFERIEAMPDGAWYLLKSEE
ncbi:MAG: hypothetical protein K2G32_08170 [Oscillospiraceae bacterium]|nr:hypothetical protein [Oscillospiraceae bacterium]